MASVLVSIEDGVLSATLNRPEKLNALSTSLTESLLGALEAGDADAGVHVIVLTGAGRAFCTGADIGEFKDLSGERAERRGELTMRLHGVFSRVKKPIIAAVRGAALGGGAGLALASDLVVASTTAKFGYPEIRHGILPAIVMANLLRQVGRKAAFELVATGEAVGAERALALGMVNRVVKDEGLMDETMRLAESLAARQPETLFALKLLFHGVADKSLEAGLEEGRRANVAMRAMYRPEK